MKLVLVLACLIGVSLAARLPRSLPQRPSGEFPIGVFNKRRIESPGGLWGGKRSDIGEGLARQETNLFARESLSNMMANQLFSKRGQPPMLPPSTFPTGDFNKRRFELQRGGYNAGRRYRGIEGSLDSHQTDLFPRESLGYPPPGTGNFNKRRFGPPGAPGIGKRSEIEADLVGRQTSHFRRESLGNSMENQLFSKRSHSALMPPPSWENFYKRRFVPQRSGGGASFGKRGDIEEGLVRRQGSLHRRGSLAAMLEDQLFSKRSHVKVPQRPSGEFPTEVFNKRRIESPGGLWGGKRSDIGEGLARQETNLFARESLSNMMANKLFSKRGQPPMLPPSTFPVEDFNKRRDAPRRGRGIEGSLFSHQTNLFTWESPGYPPPGTFPARDFNKRRFGSPGLKWVAGFGKRSGIEAGLVRRQGSLFGQNTGGKGRSIQGRLHRREFLGDSLENQLFVDGGHVRGKKSMGSPQLRATGRNGRGIEAGLARRQGGLFGGKRRDIEDIHADFMEGREIPFEWELNRMEKQWLKGRQ